MLGLAVVSHEVCSLAITTVGLNNEKLILDIVINIIVYVIKIWLENYTS